MFGRKSREAPVFEIQVHPGSVRWGVRYLFFSRRKLIVWGVLGALFTAFLVFGVLIFPSVVRGLMRAHDYQSLLTERELQGDRVQALGRELESLRQPAVLCDSD